MPTGEARSAQAARVACDSHIDHASPDDGRFDESAGRGAGGEGAAGTRSSAGTTHGTPAAALAGSEASARDSGGGGRTAVHRHGGREQQYLYNCYKNCSCNNCNLAAKPGYSNHQSGHALDLNTSASGVLGWLDANGGGCVQDSLGARCVFYACPAKGSPKVCLDDHTIGQCKDGAIDVGDCGAYAACCSTAGASDARCISADGDPCTTDGCDPAIGCSNVVLESCCADGSACGPGQVCEAGLCVTVLCAPCETDADCKDGGACLDRQGGRHCGLPCPDGTCPGGFACTDGPAGPRCTPESGGCGCGQGATAACHGTSLVQVDGCGNLLAVVEACERGCVAGACCPLGTVVKGGACVPYDPSPGHDAGGWGEDAGGGGGAGGGGDAGGPGAGAADTTGAWSPGAGEPPVTVAATTADDGCASTRGATTPAALLLLIAALAACHRRTRKASGAAGA